MLIRGCVRGARLTFLAALLLAPAFPAAAGFFDDLPRRGYVEQDFRYDAVV